MNFNKLKKFIKTQNVPPYRIGQIKDLIYKKAVSNWGEAVVLPKDLREKLNKNFPVLSFKPGKIIVSKDKKSVKALLILKDGKRIETVLLNPLKNHWSVCVSTQVGCAVKCFFCASGAMGFKRNLSTEEITDQVLFWMQYINKNKTAKRISSIVFMGMGEPLLNYSATVLAVKNLSNLDFFAIGQRNISISTCGYTQGILKLAGDLPQVNLAVSLHSADEDKRNKLVSINKIHGLTKLAAAVEKYLQKTKRRVFIEYTLIDGINDSFKDAKLLCKWVKKINSNYLLHINLISSNDFEGSKYAVSEEKIKAFAGTLKSQKISVTVRRSLGSSINAGCGQLSGG